ncbi:MAG TPA: AI-2E family transporter [Kineosporiaceae bacterium]|nr:AI-2E family transporter [Kineosporiaceae bacterium]
MTEPAPRRDGDLVPTGLRASAAWTWRLVVVAGGIYLLLLLLAQFKVLVVPVLVALLLVALIKPLADLGVRRLGLAPALAAVLTILVVLLVIIGLIGLVGQQVATGFPGLQQQSGQGLQDVRTWLANGPLHVTGEQINTWIDQAQQSMSANSSRLVSGALGVASTAADVGSGLFIALFSTFFFLAGGRGIWDFVVGLFPRGARPRVQGAAVRAWATLTAYVRATVIVAAVDAIGIGLGAAILGLPLAVPIAVLVFLGAFVPIVGAFVTGVVAVLVALVSKGFVSALIMLGIVIAVQQLEAHVLQPFLLGRAVEVHPLAVILGIGAGVLIAGIIGALFAVPLVAVGHVVAQYLREQPPEPEHEPGAPPGTPTAETPAEDADEAKAQAGPLADAPVPDRGR